MGDLVQIRRTIHTEATSKYSGHSGDIYIEKLESEDGSFTKEIIYAASPTASNFDAAPVGSWLIDTDAPATFKIHTAASTWVTVTTS